MERLLTCQKSEQRYTRCCVRPTLLCLSIHRFWSSAIGCLILPTRSATALGRGFSGKRILNVINIGIGGSETGCACGVSRAGERDNHSSALSVGSRRNSIGSRSGTVRSSFDIGRCLFQNLYDPRNAGQCPQCRCMVCQARHCRRTTPSSHRLRIGQ